MRTPIIVILTAALLTAPQALIASTPASSDQHPVLAEFRCAVQEYVDLHRRLKTRVPPFEVTADAERNRRAVDGLAAAIRAERPHAQPGDVFTNEGGRVFRARIHAALDRNAYDALVLLRARDTDDEGGWLPLTINGAFPWLAGTAMWPFMIEALPPLPAELQYRFVGRDLVLLDVHAEIVVDVLPAALPVW